MKTVALNPTQKSKPKLKGRGKSCAKPENTPFSPYKEPPTDPIATPSNPSVTPVSSPALTPKQQMFILEYLVDLNATQAAIRAGYSVKTAAETGAENLRKPRIKNAIAEAMAERAYRINVTADKVLQELAMIGFADMADFVEIDEGGAIRAFPLNTLAKGKSRIIRKVKEKRSIKSTPEGDQILDSTYEFELCEKVKSLELVGKHIGMFVEKHELEVKRPIKIVHKVFVLEDKPSGSGPGTGNTVAS